MSSAAFLPFPLAGLRAVDTRASDPRSPALATASDDALVERVARGDRDAFALLYRRYERPVFGVLLRLGGQRALAEEWLQEAFTRVWLAAGSHDAARGAVRPWISRSRSTPRAASSAASATARSTSRSTRPSSTCRTRRSGEPTLAARLDGQRRASTLAAALLELPDHLREVVVLRCSRELSVRRDRGGHGLPAGHAQVALSPRHQGAQAVRRTPAGRRAVRHPSPDALLELHFDELRTRERAPLEAHLRGCPECAARWRSSRRLERELGPGPDDAPPGDGLERVLARVAVVRPARARRAEWALAVVPCAGAMLAGAWAIRAGGERLTALGLVSTAVGRPRVPRAPGPVARGGRPGRARRARHAGARARPDSRVAREVVMEAKKKLIARLALGAAAVLADRGHRRPRRSCASTGPTGGRFDDQQERDKKQRVEKARGLSRRARPAREPAAGRRDARQRDRVALLRGARERPLLRVGDGHQGRLRCSACRRSAFSKLNAVYDQRGDAAAEGGRLPRPPDLPDEPRRRQRRARARAVADGKPQLPRVASRALRARPALAAQPLGARRTRSCSRRRSRARTARPSAACT